MPTYDYVCKGCDHAFEEFQSMSAKPLRKCPECGDRKLERLIGTGAGVIFKGGGFYETDYRSEGYKKAAEADQKAASGKDGDKGAAKAPSGESAAKKGATPEKRPGGAATPTPKKGAGGG
jgi:putative FmdB family regulatory protein